MSKSKILYFTKYPRLGASSRLRSYQYFPILERAGYSIRVSPLFDTSYVNSIFSGKKVYLSIIKGYLNRIFRLFDLWHYDLVVIEYELFPYFPAFFEYLLSKLGVKYIVDYDDAIFHNYNLNRNNAIRYLLGDKIAIVMKYSICVLAGNSYLANYAKRAGARKIDILPTVVDGSRYRQKAIGLDKKIVIGWIGSPSTLHHLETLIPIFRRLAARHEIELQIVGANKTLGLDKIEKHITWSEASEVEAILNFDIGIMPLKDTPFAQGKCSYKLIQYMACGIPVITSPVGMNKEVVDEGHNGYLASTHEEWEMAFEKMIASTPLRTRMGQWGYDIVKKSYTLQIQGPRLLNIFKELITE